MKSQIEILEELVKIDSSKWGVRVSSGAINSHLVTKLSIGDCHVQFEIHWADVESKYNYQLDCALKEMKYLLTETQ